MQRNSHALEYNLASTAALFNIVPKTQMRELRVEQSKQVDMLSIKVNKRTHYTALVVKQIWPKRRIAKRYISYWQNFKALTKKDKR